ncbi:MAG: hypothetical protein JWP78_1506 [Mucilaginibacter sp.]|nr:hypothetical protein [Mucilaginibacter sp.]
MMHKTMPLSIDQRKSKVKIKVGMVTADFLMSNWLNALTKWFHHTNCTMPVQPDHGYRYGNKKE